MARISIEDLMDDELPERPVRRRRWRRRRRRRWCMGCCLPIVIVLLCGFAVLLAAVIKTGVIQVPVLSSVLYRLPVPSRVVTPDADAQQAPEAIVDPDTSTVRISVNEEQLTLAVRRGLGTTDIIAASAVQTVIDPGGIEFFGLVRKPVSVNVTALLEPRVEDRHLAVRVRRLTLGNLAIPPSWANRIARFVLGSAMEQLDQSTKSLVVERIELRKGSVEIFVPLDSSLMKSSGQMFNLESEP